MSFVSKAISKVVSAISRIAATAPVSFSPFSLSSLSAVRNSDPSRVSAMTTLFLRLIPPPITFSLRSPSPSPSPPLSLFNFPSHVTSTTSSFSLSLLVDLVSILKFFNGRAAFLLLCESFFRPESSSESTRFITNGEYDDEDEDDEAEVDITRGGTLRFLDWAAVLVLVSPICSVLASVR